jgi:hypothetical protein
MELENAVVAVTFLGLAMAFPAHGRILVWPCSLRYYQRTSAGELRGEMSCEEKGPLRATRAHEISTDSLVVHRHDISYRHSSGKFLVVFSGFFSLSYFITAATFPLFFFCKEFCPGEGEGGEMQAFRLSPCNCTTGARILVLTIS